MGIKINLVEKKDSIIHLVAKLFNEIIDFPGETENDDETRNKINVLLEEVGTENKISFSIYGIEEKLPDFSERALDSLSDFALIEDEEPEDSEFPNAVIIEAEINEARFQARVSGLKSKEGNICVAIILLARASNFSVADILIRVEKDKIPSSFFDGMNYCLIKMLIRENTNHLDRGKM